MHGRITCFKALLILLMGTVGSLDLRPEQITQKSVEELYESLVSTGEMSGIFSPSQIDMLFEQIRVQYPQIVEFSGSVGITVNNYPINAIALHLNRLRTEANTRFDNLNRDAEPVLFVSYMMASDYVTINSAVGLLATILHQYVSKDLKMLDVLTYKTIWIVPALNLDSAQFLYRYFKEKQKVTVIYKNRRSDNYTNENKCGAHGTGVNLNKNFPRGFYYSADLTENYPCSSFYGGVKPLSEPETKGLDELVDKISPRLVVSLFGDGHMISAPDSTVAPKSDGFAALYKSWIEKFHVLNQLSGGMEMYDPIKHENPSLQSKGGNLDQYLLYDKRVPPLNYFVGLEGSKGRFLPRKEEMVKILQADAPNLLYLSCLAGSYFDLRSLEETYCKSDQTCLPVPSDVPRNYYGVKLRIVEMGTTPLTQSSPNTLLCLKIPTVRQFYIDAAFDKNKKRFQQMPADHKEPTETEEYSVSCIDLGKFGSYSEKTVYLILRQGSSVNTQHAEPHSQSVDWDMELFIKDRPRCGSQSIRMQFELQFYMLQSSSGLARGLVMGFTALALIVLCLKLFCCKRVQGEALGASDPSDSAEGVQMTNKHTRNSIDITSIEEEDPEKAVVHRSTAHQDTILEG